MAFDRLHRLIDRFALLPVVRQWRQRRFARRFRQPLGHAFFGLYDSFAAAAAQVPTQIAASYDNAPAAGMYVERLSADDYDYPALFWLQSALAGGARTICDLGGSTGIKFYAFAPLLGLHASITWHVVDVPAAAELGARIARQNAVADRLTFGSDVAAAGECDVLFVSGALQYLPHSLGELLAALPQRPRRIVVNTTPIHPTRSFFTLNNIGVACCPYRVTARDEFVDQVLAQGFVLRDEWHNLGKRLDLPFERGASIEHYSGFCFERA